MEYLSSTGANDGTRYLRATKHTAHFIIKVLNACMTNYIVIQEQL